MIGWDAISAQGRVALQSQMAAWADPRHAQHLTLQRILALSARSAFGAEHGLRPGMSVAEWQNAIPIRDAAAFAPWIDRIVGGERDVLTTEPVLAFELTGGSSGGRRAVPYTASALTDFQTPLLAWLADLLAAYPTIRRGRAYFAVSPALTRPLRQLGAYPVGLPSDLAYFGPDAAAHLAPLMIWHPALVVEDVVEWARSTAHHLVAAEDMSLISVWSPSFLDRILNQIEQDEALPRLVHDGGNGLPGHPERALALDRFRRGRFDVAQLWPGLALVSAWADAASMRPAAALRARLGAVNFQPKGLLATEGLFTLPMAGFPSALPVLTSCFLEFEHADGTILLVDEMAPGEVYSLIVTTAGGLQRYRIGDRVLATGRPDPQRIPGISQRIPMLDFVGRSNGSDLVGEKLDEAFVLTCLTDAPPGAFLAAGQAYYELWAAPGDPGRLKDFLTLLDARLRHNPQYDYARRLGQLGPLRLRLCSDLSSRYTRYRLALGHRLSDIKPLVLLPLGALHPDHWAGLEVRGV